MVKYWQSIVLQLNDLILRIKCKTMMLQSQKSTEATVLVQFGFMVWTAHKLEDNSFIFLRT